MKKIIEDVLGSDRTQDLRAVLGAKLRIATIAHLEKKRIRQPGGEASPIGSTGHSKEARVGTRLSGAWADSLPGCGIA